MKHKRLWAVLLIAVMLMSVMAAGFSAFAAVVVMEGSGTEEDPWLIATPEQLNNLRNFGAAQYEGKHFALKNDIDLTEFLDGTDEGWIAIPTFRSSLDGRGFSIKGIWTKGRYAGGLFDGLIGVEDYSMWPTIENLTIVIDADKGGISATGEAGGLAAWMQYYDIENCKVMQTGAKDAVGICAKWNAGGIAGYMNECNIRDCETDVNVYASGEEPWISDYYPDKNGDVIPIYEYDAYCAGGIVGGGVSFFGWISGCTTYGSVSTGTVGGFAQVGGIAGWLDFGTVTNCASFGDITSNSHASRAGGLVGLAYENLVMYSFSASDITTLGDSSRTGGLVGHLERTWITTCYATGDVTVQTNNTAAGGLVGEIFDFSEIENSYAAGDVTAIYVQEDEKMTPSAKLGGLVGAGGVQDKGDPEEDWDYNLIKNCYSAGRVSVSGGEANFLGGFAGWMDYTEFENCYYSPDYAGISDAMAKDNVGNSGEITSLTAKEMTQKDSFAGIPVYAPGEGHHDCIWEIYEGYGTPFLCGFENHILVMPDETSHVYNGQAHSPAITYTTKGYYNAGKPLNGSLAYADNNMVDVGCYAIEQGTLNSKFYQIRFKDDVCFDITPFQPELVLTVPDNAVYGEDAVISIEVKGVDGGTVPQGKVEIICDHLDAPVEVNLDANGKATFTVPAGTDAGVHGITAAYFGEGNYDGAEGTTELDIAKRNITIKADDKTKVEGEADPELTWSIVEGSLFGDDVISGSLKHLDNAVGVCEIVEDQPFSHPNYEITFIAGELEIKEKTPVTPGPNPTPGTPGGNTATGDTVLIVCMAVAGMLAAALVLFLRRRTDLAE